MKLYGRKKGDDPSEIFSVDTVPVKGSKSGAVTMTTSSLAKYPFLEGAVKKYRPGKKTVIETSTDGHKYTLSDSPSKV